MNKRRCFGRLAAVAGALLLMMGMLVGCTETVDASAASYTPTDRFFVNDFADVLSDAAEDQIYAQGVALQQKTKAQVVAVTVPSMDGDPIEDFAYDLANGWGIGEAEKDSGVLLLLAVEEREVRIEVGSGLEGQLPDGKTGRILDNYAIPHLQEDDYSTGLAKAYQAIVNEVYFEFGMEVPEDYLPADFLPDNAEPEPTVPLWLAIPLGLIVLVFIIRHPHLALLMLRSSRYSGGGHGGRGGGGGFSGGGGGFSGGGSSRGF